MGPVMNDVEEVGTMSEEGLRAAAMEQVYYHRSGDLPLAANEFTVGDWIDFVKKKEGRLLDKSTARRELRELEEAGVLASENRYDARTQRQAIGFWYVHLEEEEGEKVPP